MNGIVNQPTTVIKYQEFGGISYYLYILPVGTVFQAYQNLRVQVNIDIPLSKNMTLARGLASPMNYTWDGISHYNPTNEAGYDASNKKYYIDFQYQSPMSAGYNFVVALSPYIAVLQVS